ncbi:hypothetical protein [Clostridium sp. M14]|uniref:hypothetical protein n=1 Tax=Clostridium sp. M14 TaxID=2716311 RepID=UPI0013EE6E62|nr:hypothetical protein [Clostridium sp. M14]MBZ9690863.1 hypothetical protein [Clostridium sp. M14]
MNMKIAQVCFPVEMSNEIGNKKYSYFTDIDDLDWQDTVVVETRYGTRVAVFMNYLDESSKYAEKASAWIIQKVDLNGVETKKAKQRQIKDIKAKLLERKSKIEERQIFEIMAQSDPAMQAY